MTVLAFSPADWLGILSYVSMVRTVYAMRPAIIKLIG
jgi:hypothetical protein